MIILDKKMVYSEIMKKNISINISGIIFYIEENGYDRLKECLESIQKHFSTFEFSTEIIADIESRIAEIFLSKLKESKQNITKSDVENLVSTVGLEFFERSGFLDSGRQNNYIRLDLAF